jgi:hypothetical protein
MGEDWDLEFDLKGVACRWRSQDLYARWPVLFTIGDIAYRAMYGLTFESNYGDPFRISDGSSEPTGDACPTCGHIRGWQKRVAHSVEGAIAYGWLIPVAAIRERVPR